jgi:hypothetical protein
MTRILISNRTADTINHMAESWVRMRNATDAQFLGLYPITGVYTTWGVMLEDEDFAAMHVFKTKEGFYWGDDPADTAEHAERAPWVLMFYGNDNASYFLRFASREDAIEWTAKNKSIDPNGPGVMYYNS